MLDAQLQTIVQTALVVGFAARGMTVQVQQNNQPRQFAAPVGAAVFHTLASPKKAYGWPKYREAWNPLTGVFTRTRTQVVHTRFTVAGCYAQRPGAPNDFSSSDIAAIANTILQDEDFLAQLVAQGANVFRVTDLPGVWFQDSNAQNVLWSSFDIIFTHKDEYVTTTPRIDEFVGNIKSV